MSLILSNQRVSCSGDANDSQISLTVGQQSYSETRCVSNDLRVLFGAPRPFLARGVARMSAAVALTVQGERRDVPRRNPGWYSPVMPRVVQSGHGQGGPVLSWPGYRGLLLAGYRGLLLAWSSWSTEPW